VLRYRVVAAVVVAVSLLLAAAAGAAPKKESPTANPAQCIDVTTTSIELEDLPETRLIRASCEDAVGKLIEAMGDAQVALASAKARHETGVARKAKAYIARLGPRIPQVELDLPTGARNVTLKFDGELVPPDRFGVRSSTNPGAHTIHAEAEAGGVKFTFDREINLREREVSSVAIVLLPANPERFTADQIRCVLGASSLDEAVKCLPRAAASSGAIAQGQTAPRPAPKGRPMTDGPSATDDASQLMTEQQAAPTVNVPEGSKFLTAGQLKCLLLAKNQEEVTKCLPQKRGGLTVRAASEVSGYTDSTHVNVLSPSVNASVSSPTAGWNFGGSYLVDIVSAASPDIVSEASPPFHEIRQAGTFTAGYKPGLYGGQVSGNVSSEPDYLSVGGGFSLTADLNDKLVTPTVGFNFSHDTIGRSSTPFSVFHHNLDTSEFEGGAAFVMSPTSVLLLSGTLQLERGDQSKPYRYVPMFDPVTAANVRPGQSYASVNLARQSVRPLEQLPLARDRYAVGARFVHRFEGATLRLEERLYHDSWQQSATTTDMRFMTDVSDRLRLWPHLRFNAQNGVNFYRLAYATQIDPTTNTFVVPALRTGDRELSPMIGLTAGGGMRVLLTAPTSETQLAVSLQIDVLYSRYFDSLYITSRTAGYGTLGLEAEFE